MEVLKQDEKGYKATIIDPSENIFTGVLTELIIPAGARVFKGEICRADRVLVVRNIYIYNNELSEIDVALSWHKDKHDNRTQYIKGEYTYPDEFDTRSFDYSNGIHYFKSIEQMDVNMIKIIDRSLCHHMRHILHKMYPVVSLIHDAYKEDFGVICVLEMVWYEKEGCQITHNEQLVANCNEHHKGPLDSMGAFKMCGNAYIQYNERNDRGVCMISFGFDWADGFNLKCLDCLMDWFMTHDFNSKSTRRYAYMKDAWLRGIGHDLLKRYGFMVVGRGDNSKETGEWQMDLSQTIEYERYPQ